MLRKRLIISFFLVLLVFGTLVPFSAAYAAPADTKTAAGKGTQPVECLYWFGVDMTGCAAMVAWTMVKAASGILSLVGIIFNATIDYTLNFKSFLQLNPSGGNAGAYDIGTGQSGTSIVDIGWKAFRDLTNILFIFILLYIGISIIIGSSKYGSKSLLVKVLIGAVLINFSLFFTQALIDVSNVMTLQFYNAITFNNRQASGNGGTTNNAQGEAVNQGISATLLHALGIDHVTDVKDLSPGSGAAQFAEENSLDAMKLLFYCVGSILLILVTGFVLGASIVLLLIRAVTLIFLMILSPIAFAGKFLPGLDKYIGEWWDKLWSNLLFAPLYMANMYVVLKILTSQYSEGGAKPVSFATLFSGSASAAQVGFTFFIIISLMLGSLLVAQKVGAAGAKTAMDMGKKWGKGASRYMADRTLGATGRGVVGGLGYAAANSDKFKNTVGRIPLGIGGAFLRGADNMNKLKIGSKSYADSVKKREERFTRTSELHDNTIRRRGESDDDFAKRKKENKGRGDEYLGISTVGGKAVAGRPAYLGAFAERRGITAAQTARMKGKGGAEAKLETQIKDIEEKLGLDKNGLPMDKTARGAHRTSSGNGDWGKVHEAREAGVTEVKRVETEIAAKKATLDAVSKLPPTPARVQQRIALTAEMTLLMEQKGEYKEAVKSAETLEEKYKQLLVQKDQAGK